MGKITVDQVTKINNMCSNEWMLDVQYFHFHNEKTLIKRIRLDERNFLEYRLSYNSRNQICLHISKFTHEPQDEMASTSGMGKRLLDINKNTPVATGYGLILQSEEF